MVVLGVFLFVLGAGIGMTMQNLVLAVQNTVAARDLGAASSAVAFFRSLGGATGVSVLGAILGTRVTTHIGEGLAARGIDAAAMGRSSNSTKSFSSSSPSSLSTTCRTAEKGTGRTSS